MLCRMAGFKPGLIFLYENLRLFREVLQVGLPFYLPSCYSPSSMRQEATRYGWDPGRLREGHDLCVFAMTGGRELLIQAICMEFCCKIECP